MGASHPTSSWWPRLTVLAGLVVTASVVGMLGVVLARGFVSWLGPSNAQDWASHPLEVVAEGSQDACMLNVDALAPGDHDVLVVAVDARSRVRIVDPSGAEVFRAAGEPAAASPVDGSVSLEVGTYRVVCDIEDGATATVPLRVRPADELD